MEVYSIPSPSMALKRGFSLEEHFNLKSTPNASNKNISSNSEQKSVSCSFSFDSLRKLSYRTKKELLQKASWSSNGRDVLLQAICEHDHDFDDDDSSGESECYWSLSDNQLGSDREDQVMEYDSDNETELDSLAAAECCVDREQELSLREDSSSPSALLTASHQVSSRLRLRNRSSFESSTVAVVVAAEEAKNPKCDMTSVEEERLRTRFTTVQVVPVSININSLATKKKAADDAIQIKDDYSSGDKVAVDSQQPLASDVKLVDPVRNQDIDSQQPHENVRLLQEVSRLLDGLYSDANWEPVTSCGACAVFRQQRAGSDIPFLRMTAELRSSVADAIALCGTGNMNVNRYKYDKLFDGYQVLERYDNDAELGHVKMKGIGFIYSPRDFIHVSRITHAHSDGSSRLHMAAAPARHVPAADGTVRGELNSLTVWEQVDAGLCRMTVIADVDIKGSIPVWLINKLSGQNCLQSMQAIKKYVETHSTS